MADIKKPQFKGNIAKGEVDVDLPEFVNVLNENYTLKEKLAKSEEENPWKNWIYFARMTDAWRPLPRLFFGSYIVMLYQSVQWFMAQPEPSAEQAGLVSVLVGAGAAWFNSYVKTKGDGNRD